MVNDMSLQNFANLYANQFIFFVNSYNIQISVEEAYYLLDYTLCNSYGLECMYYTEGIRMYGNLSMNVLNSLVAFDGSLSYDERVSLVALSKNYFVALTGCRLH